MLTSIRRDYGFGLAVFFAAVFAAACWSSSSGMNMLWDERVDLSIVRSLIDRPLVGIGADPSQGRLPMYVTALTQAILRPPTEKAQLADARMASIAFGMLAIILLYVLGRRWFGRPTALLASFLLAVSPYFMGFSRLAVTEGDAYCAPMLLLALFAFDRFRRERSDRAAFLLALALGLVSASKFFLYVFVGSFFLADGLDRVRGRGGDGWKALLRRPWFPHRGFLLWCALPLSLEAVTVAVRSDHIPDGAMKGVVSVALWGTGLALLALGAYQAFSSRAFGPLRLTGTFLTWPELGLGMATIGWAACLALFPSHVLQPAIAEGFLDRLFAFDARPAFSILPKAVRLYSGLLLFKLGLPLGILTLAALVWSLARLSRDPATDPLTLCFGALLLTALALPLAQPFYLMTVYPILILLLSAFVLRVGRGLPGIIGKTGGAALLAFAIGWLLYGDFRVYPTFGYYGYETIGDQWWNDRTTGYRNIVTVNADGAEDALLWCRDHLPAGKRVLFDYQDKLPMQEFVRQKMPRFEMVHIFDLHRDEVPSLDYAVISLDEGLLETPYTGKLRGVFSDDALHTVWRGRGPYRLPVFRVVARANAAGAPFPRSAAEAK